MLSKIRGLFVSFVKPLILAHVSDLSQLTPMVSDAIVKKTNLTKAQADALTPAVIDVLESELVVLINKI